mgnify:CR=1 FL=1
MSSKYLNNYILVSINTIANLILPIITFPYISRVIGAEYLGWYYTGKWNSMACFNLGIMVFPINNLSIGFSIYNLSFSKFINNK